MGHELATINGRTSMMYVGEIALARPGYQARRPRHRPRDHQAAGLDFDVSWSSMKTTDGIPIPAQEGGRPDRHQ